MNSKSPTNLNKNTKKVSFHSFAITVICIVGLILIGYFLVENYYPQKPPTVDNNSSIENVEPNIVTPPANSSLYPTDKLFVTKERKSYKNGDMLLSVPRLNLVDSPVLDGAKPEVIDYGIGLYDYAQLPDNLNFNTSITAHRNMEFEFIDTITTGDLFSLKYNGIEYTFEYEETIIVDDEDWSIVHCRDYPIVTLISCHPVNSSKNRMCVIGKLISQKEIVNKVVTEETAYVDINSQSKQASIKGTKSSLLEVLAFNNVTYAQGTLTAPKTTVLTPIASGTNLSYNAGVSIDASNISSGYVMVKYDGKATKLKLQITGPDSILYTYSIRSGKGFETFPLTGGNGNYKVAVYENVKDSAYALAHSTSFNATITDPLKPYLYPNQYVNFTKNSATVAKGASLATGSTTELETVEKVYNYVTKNIKYDNDKASKVQSGYVPVVDNTLSSGKGICFDYAAIMATMLRTQNIPTRLEVGYTSNNIYHSWISVHLKDKGWVNGIIKFDGKVWQLMDPTFASNANGSPDVMQYIGNSSNYKTKYVY